MYINPRNKETLDTIENVWSYARFRRVQKIYAELDRAERVLRSREQRRAQASKGDVVKLPPAPTYTAAPVMPAYTVEASPSDPNRPRAR